ncbi:class I glutamine amidotransferase-like protein [Clohesyomyces aquaticus]|uniref:Class I glutamine amidotransferase-like protein n=1 Tax=Clohesyomyces aquaticus TaxID=1231657 RepID=A0A1Y1ZVI7_9PLEO|nr:class I glutamine amidotransferase-like protein [Clohesyomyces aquaticus]
MSSTQTPLRIGVLHENVQMTDLSGLDILGNISTQTLEMVLTMMPQFSPLLPLSVPMEFLYISSTLSPAAMTCGLMVMPTHTYATAPRDLDIILVGGPDPTKVHPESLVFLKEAVEAGTKAVLATCTGGMWVAKSGILDGRKATTNRSFLAMAGQMFPKVEWLDQRWVVDEVEGKGTDFWTAGGAGCGVDMVIEYVRKRFDSKIVGLSLMGLDFDPEGPHGQAYTKPLPTFA